MNRLHRLAAFREAAHNAPWQALGDIYTLCGQEFAGEAAIAKSVYNLTFRRAPSAAWPGLASDGRLVMYGMADFVRQCLDLPEAIDPAHTRDVARFMGTRHALGGPLNFDRRPWDRAYDEFGGHLPIRIEAVPDGTAFLPGEPVVQVTSLAEGYGEFAALVEATLLGMISCATARATVSFHLLERMRREVRANHPGWHAPAVDQKARGMVHDFGMRASSTPLEAEIFGRAHLLAFNGTDTTSASYSAWRDSDGRLNHVGTSILAHAHRIILGHESEEDAVRSLADAIERCGDIPIGSFLCDTYHTKTFVEKLAIPLALEYRRRGQGVCVVRPDSGDLLENIGYLVEQAYLHGLYRDDPSGMMATHLTILLGDSMNPRKIDQAFERLRGRECNSVSWCNFGIGGWLRAQGNRDVLSAAYKLASKGAEDRPVVKLSETLAKLSVPGPTTLVRHEAPSRRDDPTVYLGRDHPLPPGSVPIYKTFYNGSRSGEDAIGEACLASFAAVRERANATFDALAGRDDTPVLSESILNLQRAELARHRGV